VNAYCSGVASGVAKGAIAPPIDSADLGI